MCNHSRAAAATRCLCFHSKKWYWCRTARRVCGQFTSSLSREEEFKPNRLQRRTTRVLGRKEILSLWKHTQKVEFWGGSLRRDVHPSDECVTGRRMQSWQMKYNLGRKSEKEFANVSGLAISEKMENNLSWMRSEKVLVGPVWHWWCWSPADWPPRSCYLVLYALKYNRQQRLCSRTRTCSGMCPWFIFGPVPKGTWFPLGRGSTNAFFLLAVSAPCSSGRFLTWTILFLSLRDLNEPRFLARKAWRQAVFFLPLSDYQP